MAILLSSTVADTDTITADQLNRLAEDLAHLHAHVPNADANLQDGAQISHANVTDGEGEHAMIDVHASATSNPGGSMGVHGVPADRYVLGVGPDQYEFRWGTHSTTDWDPDTREQRGKADIGFPRFVEPVALALFQPLNCPAGIVTWYKMTENSVSFKVRIPSVGIQTPISVFWLVFGKVPQ